MMTDVEDNFQTDIEATYRVQHLADAKEEYFHMTSKYQAGERVHLPCPFPGSWF